MSPLMDKKLTLMANEFLPFLLSQKAKARKIKQIKSNTSAGAVWGVNKSNVVSANVPIKETPKHWLARKIFSSVSELEANWLPE
jgi:hypothetical protein